MIVPGVWSEKHRIGSAELDRFADQLSKQYAVDTIYVTDADPDGFGATVISAPNAGGAMIAKISGSIAEIRVIGPKELKRQKTELLAERHQPSPPIGAHYLLRLCLPQQTREPLIGDLVEEFTETILPTFGPRRARVWFWTQTLRSLFPVVRARLWKLATMGWLIELMRHGLR